MITRQLFTDVTPKLSDVEDAFHICLSLVIRFLCLRHFLRPIPKDVPEPE